MTAVTCVFTDDPPRVAVDVTDMPSGTATLTLTRISESGQQTVVRGMDGVAITGTDAWTGTDWDTPVGRSPIWRATMRNAAGGVLGTCDGQLWGSDGAVSDLVGELVGDTVGGGSRSLGPELVVNGGAESGMSDWTLGEGSAWTASIDTPHSGASCLMGPLVPGATMAQTVAATTATLRLSLWTRWQSDSTATLTVTSGGASQNVPLTRGASRVWTQTIADLAVTPGPVTLTFTSTSTQRFAVDDVSARSASDPIQAPIPGGVPAIDDCSQAWISNPYDPLSAMLVTLMDPSDADTSHDMDVSLSLPGRATHLPSAVVGVRGLGGKRELIVRCWTLDEALRFEQLLTSAVTLLVRANPGTIRHRTGALYVVPGEVTEHRERDFIDGPEETTWTLACDEVDPGRIGVLVPPWMWATSRAYVAQQAGKTQATWADRMAVFPLWIDATRGL